MIDRLIDVVEARHLLLGGGGGKPIFEAFITSSRKRGSATEQDRAALDAFLETDPDIESYRIGALKDAWNGAAE